MRFVYYISGVVLLTLLTGCSKTPSAEQEIKDLSMFPQNAQEYMHNIQNRSALIDLQTEYEKIYFEPWNYKEPPFTKEAILWPFSSYTYGKSYAENLQPLEEEWFIEMQKKGNYGAYGSMGKKAISLHYLHLRNFPTQKPLLKDPKQAGEGFPFDYMQNSGVHANEPLYVSHLSTDRAWAYIFTSYVTGWVPLKNIAFIDEEVASKWQNAKQIELISENHPIKDLEGNFVFKSRVGMRLALISIHKTHYVALAITAGKNHSATYTQVKIPLKIATDKTMTLNAKNLSYITNLMLKSNYGWGGLYEERDCSSMLRDLYSPFGLWLPRNSSQQARVGKVISLKGLTQEEKRQKIKDEAIPFETLLYKKGHILLYLGEYKGEIAVLHNVWGIKTVENGISGRKVIGRTVVSSLELGSERKDYDSEKGILSQLLSMNIITQQ